MIGPPRAPARKTPSWSGLAVALLAVGAAVRGLRFFGEFVSWAHWDEARLANPAIHILAGDFPVHHLGVEYMGASPSYPLAVWFALFGSSPRSLDVFAYGVGLAILWTGYLVARRLLPPRPALVALAVLAVPPVYLARWSLTANLNHPMLLVLGNLLLLGTHTLCFRAHDGVGGRLFVLGLLAGVGWWTNPLIAVYVVPLALLAVRTGLAWRPRALLFPSGVLLGGLPAWLYEIGHFPSARFALLDTGSVPADSPLDRIVGVVTHHLPNLFVVQPDTLTVWGAGLAPTMGALVGLLSLVRAAVRDRQELRWVAGLGAQPGTGGSLLWGVLVANLSLFVLGRRTGASYVLALYSVLPCWIGEAAIWLAQWRRSVAATALIGMFAFQLHANWSDTLGTVPAARARWTPLETRAAPLIDWLLAHGLRRVYWAGVPSFPGFEFTYLSGTRVIAVDPWREEDPAHARLVDAAPRPAFVTGADPTSLEEGLRGLGMRVRATQVAGFHVLEAEPGGPGGFVPLPSEGWTVTASHNPAAAANLLDRDVSTGWATGVPQEPGQWLAVNLGHEETVTRVDLLAVDWQDIPAGFRVEVSPDGRTWRSVAAVPDYWGPFFFSEQHAFLKVRRGRVQAIFPPVRARHLRVVQTGSLPVRDWGARELFVYRPGPPLPAVPRAPELVDTLRRAGVHFVYADHWLSALVRTESAGAVAVYESNLNTNAYGRGPDPSATERVRLRPGQAILAGSDTDGDAIREMLDGQRVPLRDGQAGPYRLFTIVARPRDARRVSHEGWRASASEDPGHAGLAIDGDLSTAWPAAGPASHDARLTVDLGVVRPLSEVRVRPSPRVIGATDLRLEGSPDGVTWTPLGPLGWRGRLYWTGSELLRNGKDGWAVGFHVARVRYLRLSAVGPASAGWVVGELDCAE